ncbi:MAG: DUF11 domain-containing protein [Anaerolineales bacterium]|nr:MAG: DUF11 domain-containing protein [Anaerolineales bacterium]
MTAADVTSSVRSGTYDNTASGWSTQTGDIDDAGTVAQDADTPSGEDPEYDEDVTVIGAQLTIDKDTTTPTVGAGGVATYAIALHNPGTITTTGVVVTDTVPLGFTYAGGSAAESSANCTSTSDPSVGERDLDWGTWDIYPGGRVTITFGCNVATSVTPGTYENTALAESVETGMIDHSGPTGQDADTPAGEDPEEDEDVTVTSILNIDKDTSTPMVEQGGVATYTIALTNPGSVTVTNVVVTDTLPSGFTYASGSVVASGAARTSTSNPSVGDSTLYWGTWDVGGGGAFTITFSTNVATTTPVGSYDNTAQAASSETGYIDDEGTLAQDSSTPPGQDPETDEDVTVIARPPVRSTDKSSSRG